MFGGEGSGCEFDFSLVRRRSGAYCAVVVQMLLLKHRIIDMVFGADQHFSMNVK